MFKLVHTINIEEYTNELPAGHRLNFKGRFQDLEDQENSLNHILLLGYFCVARQCFFKFFLLLFDMQLIIFTCS